MNYLTRRNEKIRLFGLNMENLTPRLAEVRVLDALSQKDRCRLLFTPNLEMLARAKEDKDVRKLLNRADLLLPDGVGVALAARLYGKRISGIIPGIEMGQRILIEARRRALRVFLLGGGEGVADLAASALRSRMPRLNICGTHHGYFAENDEKRVIEKIKEARADILFICMGFPRQEAFAVKIKDSLPACRLIACLGGSLDVWSQKVKRAPAPLRRAHAEWLYRVLAQPSRIPRLLSSLPALAHPVKLRMKIYCRKNF